MNFLKRAMLNIVGKLQRSLCQADRMLADYSEGKCFESTGGCCRKYTHTYSADEQSLQSCYA